MKHFILLVDDESDNLDALERIFRRKYNVLKASSGDQGLSLLKKQKVSLIISDQRMPEMTGVEFLQKSVDIQASPIRILLTGYTDIESVISAINSGQIYKYMTKPWDPVDLLNTVDKAVEKFELRAELQNKNKQLEKALLELKELDTNKTQFMTLVNHELKTPLTILKSYTDILSEGSLDDEQKLFVSKIKEANKKLSLIVNRTLLLIESTNKNSNQVAPEPLSLLPLIEQVQGSINFSSERSFQNPQSSLWVMSGKKELLQIFEEIYQNAKEHGVGDVITTWTEKENENQIQVTNRITDPIENPEKLLKPFYLDENMLNHSKGMGIGLSIAQQNARVLGSNLELSSSSSEFSLIFSLKKASV